MAAVKELLRAEADGTLSFGDYTLGSKTKLDGFAFQGDQYKVKTFSEITKLEKNGMFVYGDQDAQFTLELEADSEYIVYMDGVNVGDMKTNLSGKLSVSAELESGKSVEVKIVKK